LPTLGILTGSGCSSSRASAHAWATANWLYCRYGYRLTTPAVRPELVEGLSNSVLSIDLIGPFPPHPLGRFANRPLAGAGQGGKGLPLGNPGPSFMPTVGKAPRSGPLFTGREPHAIPGVTLPLPVILTAHRLRSPLLSARQTAWTWVIHS